MARQTEPAPSEIQISGNVFTVLHRLFTKTVAAVNGRHLYVNLPLVFGMGTVDQISFFYTSHSLSSKFTHPKTVEALIKDEFGSNCEIRIDPGVEDGMQFCDYYLWFKTTDNSKGAPLVGCYKLRMYIVETVTTALLLRLGYRGYGKLISNVISPFDFVFENERVEYQIKAGNGEVLHSVYVTEDSHAVDSVLGIARSFPRISYGVNTAGIFMEKLVSSPLFTLKGACLNEDLTSTVETPSAQLAAFQEYVIQKHQVDSFPETPQKQQQKFVLKFLTENISEFSKLNKSHLDYHYRKQIFASKLEEVKILMGEVPFSKAISGMRAAVSPHKFEFEILSGNPISLTEKLRAYL